MSKKKINIRLRLENHYRRWNISFDQEEQFRRLKNRVRSVLNSVVGRYIAENPAVDREFAEILGEDIGVEEYRYVPTSTMRALEEVREGRRKQAFGATRVCEAVDNSEDLPQLVSALQVLFIVLERHEWPHIVTLVNGLRRIIGLTPQVEFRIARRDKSVVLYPAGAEPLDEGAVEEVLTWLRDCPKAARPFERALRTYMRGDVGDYRSLFDDLRLALEALLRYVLQNDKRLEQQERDLSTWVEHRELHQEVRSMYTKLLFGPYRIYQNRAVKHGEEYSAGEAEFMIYLTGTFMRLLLQLQARTR